MNIKLDDELLEVKIVRKKTTKNTYLRLKEDKTIYITTNIRTKDCTIIDIINENKKSILKMVLKQENRNKDKDYFFWLGERYDIVLTEDSGIKLDQNKAFIEKDIDLDNWYKKQANMIFKEHLDDIYNNFTRQIPYPKLTIRKMKSRWGVCNTKTKRVTLNLELIKKDLKYLDYVIAHELSHLVEANHSNKFWQVVEENIPTYKKIRKEMKDF